ncbi:FUN14 domain-containing protein [Thermococcus sp.]|uniref:FUN14 domain-containing protein n=1 Tax=Thermococcus sp. TaxID=35749 RepID=UPI0026044C56|nr:FUN14 domain-containing protein [Thermococcus sp.]
MNFDLNGMVGDLGFGGIAGFVTGYALKKFMKIVLTILGAYILSLFWLQQKGVLTINTEKLFNLTGSAASQVVGLAQKAIGILPGTTAFVAGFYLGFQKG